MREIIIIVLAVLVLTACGKKEPNLVGHWNGQFSAESTKNDFGGHAPAVSLNLSADHTFELTVGTKTTGRWTYKDHTVQLKAEQRNGQPIPPGGDGQEISLKLSGDGTSMESPAQPITFTKA
jgi:hypothetical protein